MNKLSSALQNDASPSAGSVGDPTVFAPELSSLRASSRQGTLTREQTRQWKVENRDAIDAYNAWISNNGLVLDGIQEF